MMIVIYLGVVTDSTPCVDDVKTLPTISRMLIEALFLLNVPVTWKPMS